MEIVEPAKLSHSVERQRQSFVVESKKRGIDSLDESNQQEKKQKRSTIDQTDPDICKQWHPTRNGILKSYMFTRGMRKKIWWHCEKTNQDCTCPHDYESPICDRCCKGKGCPYCARQKHCYHESIVKKFPRIAAQWNSTKNGDLSAVDFLPKSSKKVWWKCEQTNCTEKCPHEYKSRISDKSRKEHTSGCPYCSGHKICTHNSFAFIFPNSAKKWHPTKNKNLLPTDVSPHSKDVFMIMKQQSLASVLLTLQVVRFVVENNFVFIILFSKNVLNFPKNGTLRKMKDGFRNILHQVRMKRCGGNVSKQIVKKNVFTNIKRVFIIALASNDQQDVPGAVGECVVHIILSRENTHTLPLSGTRKMS